MRITPLRYNPINKSNQNNKTKTQKVPSFNGRIILTSELRMGPVVGQIKSRFSRVKGRLNIKEEGNIHIFEFDREQDDAARKIVEYYGDSINDVSDEPLGSIRFEPSEELETVSSTQGNRRSRILERLSNLQCGILLLCG